VSGVYLLRYSKGMPPSEKDRSARVVLKRWVDLQSALSDQRKYPVEHFKAFVEAARRYIELTQRDPLIHRSVADAIHGLTDFLEVERKRVPGDILGEAGRLECLFFVEYDPHFNREEPLGRYSAFRTGARDLFLPVRTSSRRHRAGLELRAG
jgi:hypothetical protein